MGARIGCLPIEYLFVLPCRTAPLYADGCIHIHGSAVRKFAAPAIIKMRRNDKIMVNIQPRKC